MKSKTKCYLQVNIGTSQIKNSHIYCKLSFENHINQLWVKDISVIQAQHEIKDKCYLQVNIDTSQIKNSRIHCTLSFENHKEEEGA